MLLLRVLLAPLSVVYALVIAVRNLLYRAGILGRTSFDIPIICVGNLSFGGTGKTPHLEYLIRLLRPHKKIAVLSRGYRRKTAGYVFASATTDAAMIGDEPFQIKNKFREVAVGVCENRVLGVPNLLADAPDTEVILMDDGFQHLAIQAGLNILLTDHSRLFTRDFIAPSGTLREFRAGYMRAQIIVVTKCPPNLSWAERQQITTEIAPTENQHVFFSYETYGEPVGLFEDNYPLNQETDVLLFAGIARTGSLEKHLASKFRTLTAMKFADHKHYDTDTVKDIIQRYQGIDSANKAIFTTEKDAVKLQSPEIAPLFQGIPIFYQPLAIEFFEEDREHFNQLITTYAAHTNQ